MFVNNSKSKRKFRDDAITDSDDRQADGSFAWNELIGVDAASLVAAYGGKTHVLNNFDTIHHVKIENKWSVDLVTALPADKASIPDGPTEKTVAKKGTASKVKARLLMGRFKAGNESVDTSPSDLGGGVTASRKRSSSGISDANDNNTSASSDADVAKRPQKKRKTSSGKPKPSISKEAAMVGDAIARLGPKDMGWASSSLVGQLASMIRDGRKATASAEGEGESTKFCPSTELQTLAYEVINAVTDSHSGFATLQYRDASDKSRSVTYLKLFQPSNKEAKDLVQTGGFAAIMSKRAKSVMTLVSHYDDAYDAETGKSLIAKVAKDLDYTVFKESEFELASHEISHLRDFIGTSTTGMGRLNDFYRATRNVELFPTSYPSLVKEYEEQFALPYKSVMVPLYISSSDDMGSGKTEPCLFIYSADPCLIAESITQAAISSNTFEESFTFCKLRKRVILVMGSDRGDGAYSKLIRLANRTKGNTAEHCQIMAHYDRGAECYENIKTTVANPEYPIRDFDRQAENDLLHMMLVIVKDEKGKMIDGRAYALHFHKRITRTRRSGTAEVAELAYETEIQCVQREDIFTTLPPLSPRSKAEDIPIGVTNEDAAISIRLAASSNNACPKEYDGFVLHDSNSNQEVFRSQFRYGGKLTVPKKATVSVECQRIEAFDSSDVKNYLIQYGVNGASAGCSCPCCTAICVKSHNSYDRVKPEWQGAVDTEMKNDVDELKREGYRTGDAPLRDGPHWDLDACHERYLRLTGDGKFNIGPDTQSRYRKECASVVNKPLTDRPAHKKPLNCMHSPANTMKHYFQYLRTSLANIDRDSPFHLLVKELLSEAETQLNDTGAWKQTKSLDESYSRRIKLAENKAEQYQNEGNDMMYTHWMDEVAEIMQERLANANDGFGNAHKLRAGMETFVESAKFYLDKKSKKPRGPVSYAINKSFEIDGKARFLADKGGFDLTHKDNLKVAENWEKIVARVNKTYPDDPDRQQRVQDLMNGSRDMVKDLLEMASILKSQSKITTAKLEALKIVLTRISKRWRKEVPNKLVFLSYHILEAHVVAFIERYEAYARFGEEGFESSHPHIKKIKELLRTIGSVECRTSNLSRRMSTSLDPKQQKLSSRIRTFKEGRPRPGGYQTNRIANDVATASGVIGSSGNMYFSVGKDAILPRHWREAFELCEYGRAPAAWREAFISDDSLDGSQKIKAEYTSHK